MERALAATSVLAQRYRSFSEVVDSGALAENPMFTTIDQPGVGSYLAAGLPASFDGTYFGTGPAHPLGQDTTSVVGS